MSSVCIGKTWSLSAFLSGMMSGIVAFAAGCSPTTPKLVEKPRMELEKVLDTGVARETFNPKIDILFVIDDSGSMLGHQSNLAKNFGLFTKALGNLQFLDYHIGVITSSVGDKTKRHNDDDQRRPPKVPDHQVEMRDGKLVGRPYVVNRSTRNQATILQRNLQVGKDGNGEERFFDPVYLALSEPLVSTLNEGFLRNDASLAIFFITDTEDQSELISADELFRFLVKLKGSPEQIFAYGVFAPQVMQVSCKRDDEWKGYLDRFIELAQGKTFGLCDDDYGQQLAALSDDIVNKTTRTMYLSRRPIPSTIEMRYGTQVVPNDARKGWSYQPGKNALHFGSELEWTTQPPGTELEVNFTAAGSENE